MLQKVLLIFVTPVFICSGCFSPDSLLTQNNMQGETISRLPTRLPEDGATKEAAVRVAKIGRKIINANPQMGIRPAFHVVGAPHAEIFHQGTEQILVTEGLVNQCTDDQVGAIISIELAKILAERGQLPVTTAKDRGATFNIPIGNDRNSVFGPPDGVRLVELAEEEKSRARDGLPNGMPADPRIVASSLLAKAGMNPGSVGSVSSLLKKVEDNYQLEKQMKKPLPVQPGPISLAPLE